MEPSNQKSQIAQEYGLLPADARQQLPRRPIRAPDQIPDRFNVWNFSRWVADVPPGETSLAARSKEKQLYSQATMDANKSK